MGPALAGPTMYHGAAPGARAAAIVSYSCCVYSYLQIQLSYRYTATFTGRYKVQLHLYSNSCSGAPRDAPGGVWNMLTVIMHDKNLKEKQVTA